MMSAVEIDYLVWSGVTATDVIKELEYRDKSNHKWNDMLFDFEIEELEELSEVLEKRGDTA